MQTAAYAPNVVSIFPRMDSRRPPHPLETSGPEWMTQVEVARWLGVTPRTIRNWQNRAETRCPTSA